LVSRSGKENLEFMFRQDKHAADEIVGRCLLFWRACCGCEAICSVWLVCWCK